MVLVLYHHELFANGIVGLLREKGFSPIGLDARSKDALERVQALRPRLILVEDNDPDSVFATKLKEILKRNPEVGVIRINIESNLLSIYSARQVMATGPEDLFDAIERLANCSVLNERQQQPV